MPLSSLHTIRLLASIARQAVDDLDTLAENERDAGSEESGVDSLHMSSDESDTEERIERRRERRRDSDVEPSDEPVDESTSLPPHDPFPALGSEHPSPRTTSLDGLAVRADAAFFRPPHAHPCSPHGSAAANSKSQTLYCVSTALDVAIDSASPEGDELLLRGHPPNPQWAFFERPRPRIAINNETDN